MATETGSSSEIFKGSLRDRIMGCRRDLALELFENSGPFAEAISRVRERWQIKPHETVPDWKTAYKCEGSAITFYVPASFPAELPVSPLPDTWPDWWFPTDVFPGDVLQVDPASVVFGNLHPLLAWYLDLKRLHDHHIPESARMPPIPYREAGWVGYLSACVLYQPPADRLLAFARHLFPEFMARPTRGGVAPRKETVVEDGPIQYGSPIVHLEDAQEIESALEARNCDVWAFFRRYVSLVYDVDLNDLFHEAVSVDPDTWEALWSRYTDRILNVSTHGYIWVGQETTRADVIDAFKVMKGGFAPPQKGRPERDRLTSVQAAIWSDRFGMTNQEIAKRLRWTLNPREGAKARSERVRDHIVAGRAILSQKKPAT